MKIEIRSSKSKYKTVSLEYVCENEGIYIPTDDTSQRVITFKLNNDSIHIIIHNNNTYLFNREFWEEYRSGEFLISDEKLVLTPA